MEPITLDTFKDIAGIEFWQSGTWLWCKGPRELFTEEVRSKLKASGFRFSASKAAWYKPPEGCPYRRGSKTIPQIKEEYGADKVQTNTLRHIFYRND